jgi:L-lactate dehydrogenase complex protein LldG
MSEARDAVLGRLRQSLRRSGDGADAAQAVADHLAGHAGIIPARGDLDLAGRIALFTAQAEAVQASVQRIGSNELPSAVVAYLRAHNLPMRLVMAPDPALERDWPELLEIRRGPAEDGDAVGLTSAFAGIAETGTLMLLSGPQTPTTVAFLPETSIVALARRAGAARL